jgi:hypothetical protein
MEAIAPVEFFDVEGAPLAREAVLAPPEQARWDGMRLEEGVRTHAATMEGAALGSAEFRLERVGGDWVSVVTVEALGSTQTTTLRFSAESLTPRGITQSSNGPIGGAAMLTVSGGRLTGTLELPPQLGGSRTLDEPLPEGILLAGMDEYALAVAPLDAQVKLTLPYFDLISGRVVRLEARVTGEADLTVPAGTFSTWRLEVTGGEAPLTLYLRKEAPHILVRQELAGQAVRFDLVDLSPL